MVWLEYDVDPATSLAINGEVWTAPYTESAAALMPRRIDTLPQIDFDGAIRVGFGYAAAPDGNGGLRVYRLADGAHADLTPPSGEFWFPASYVGPTEIAVAARGADALDTTQLCFIRIDSLPFPPIAMDAGTPDAGVDAPTGP
jgi:hypothetical protein